MTRVALIGLLVWATPLTAQQPPTPTGPPLAFRGEVGTIGEVYAADGLDGRRPPATGRLYLRSSVTLFGQVTADVDLLLSSEGGAALSGTPGLGRQRINRFGLTPKWSWGRVYLGSFTDRYSRFTLNGIRVSGAGFAINPGLLRAASVVGTTGQPVFGGATDGSYRRRLVGGRLGVGRGAPGGASGSFVDVMLLRAWDDEQSLPVDSAPLDPVAGIPVNNLSVTPQENVVVGTAAGLDLLGGRLRLGGEASVALHSRDRRAPELDETTVPSYPGFLRALLTPRVGSHADYAYRLDARLRIARLPGGSPRSPRTLDVAGEYVYIGPGYVSLGVASLPVDQQAIGLRSQLRFPRWTVGVTSRIQHDNLLGQKLSTTDRLQLGGSVTFRPTRQWTASLRGNLLDMANDAVDSLRAITYASRTLSVANTISLRRSTFVRSVSVTYGYRDAGDENPLRADATLTAHNADVRVALSPSRIFQITPSVGIVRARSGTKPWSTRESYALSATARLLEGRWSTTVAAGTSRAAPNRSMRASLSSQFHLTSTTSVWLQLSAQQFRGLPEEDSDFREYVVNLRVVRRLK